MRVLSGPERERTLRLLGRERDGGPDRLLLLACQRPFAAGARVRLVWGRGIAAADDAALRVRQEQRFQWTVRARLLAEFSCERENARAACLPLRPMRLAINAPVPRALAQAVRLVPAAGGAAAAARRRRPARHQPVLRRPAAREHALHADPATAGGGRRRSPAGQRHEFSARSGHRRAAAAGALFGIALCRDRSAHGPPSRPCAAADDAAPRPSRSGRQRGAGRAAHAASRRGHARRHAAGMDHAAAARPGRSVPQPREAAARARSRRAPPAAAGAAPGRAARHRGDRRAAARPRPAHRRGRIAAARPGAVVATQAEARAHRRARHQPGRALQARAQLQPRVGDDARPRPPGAGRGRGRERLPGPTAVEWPHRRAGAGAHHERLRRALRRVRRWRSRRRTQAERGPLPEPRRPLRHRARHARRPGRTGPGVQPLAPRHRALALWHRHRAGHRARPPRPRRVQPHAAARGRAAAHEALRAH